jgi:hypothetical protein
MGSLKGRSHPHELGVDGRTTLKLMLHKYPIKHGKDISDSKKGYSNNLSCTRQRIIRSDKETVSFSRGRREGRDLVY